MGKCCALVAVLAVFSFNLHANDCSDTVQTQVGHCQDWLDVAKNSGAGSYDGTWGINGYGDSMPAATAATSSQIAGAQRTCQETNLQNCRAACGRARQAAQAQRNTALVNKINENERDCQAKIQSLVSGADVSRQGLTQAGVESQLVET